MTSIIDVAKVAGVSKSTVSRLISGKGYVSADSQEKILKAMKELNYTRIMWRGIYEQVPQKPLAF